MADAAAIQTDKGMGTLPQQRTANIGGKQAVERRSIIDCCDVATVPRSIQGVVPVNLIDTFDSKLAITLQQKHWHRPASPKAKDNFVHGLSTVKDVKEARFRGVYLMGFCELHLR